ncbi:DNA-dependent RNA polymerase subunit epsilon [Fictibacillus phosphorivorans]|uniref:DNA-dependent RNA polymerase subunit epsilon n=1 Tax=Fictibacillus phosphorivorans TaxID=1221500 RepID=UPI002041D3F3|nr:RNA polymerase epsilon subunit [Fictibacillus phosphorivorans]MCM3720328.1 DNA-directed RNA polymerase subunit epsilon [Fictibacillus phosphorivorans]MCM3778018.1 DNA-directed RNA polymerase subunit epsilon [Fictibacillus phosphorivorans]
MIFKVFFQPSIKEVPIRERTQSVYVEAETINEVRLKLADRSYNIEYIQEINGKFLEYEKETNSLELENV